MRITSNAAARTRHLRGAAPGVPDIRQVMALSSLVVFLRVGRRARASLARVVVDRLRDESGTRHGHVVDVSWRVGWLRGRLPPVAAGALPSDEPREAARACTERSEQVERAEVGGTDARGCSARRRRRRAAPRAAAPSRGPASARRGARAPCRPRRGRPGTGHSPPRRPTPGPAPAPPRPLRRCGRRRARCPPPKRSSRCSHPRRRTRRGRRR